MTVSGALRLSRGFPPTWFIMLALGLLLAPLTLPAHAQDLQPVPALSGRVVDQARVLSEPQRNALETKLAAFESQSGPQIVLLLVASTQPEDIAAYAQRIADTWKIGRRGVGDGLLVVVARDDRKIRIEVAKALEGAVPDLAARQIIDRSIGPAFKQGDYAGGLNAGVDALMERVRGEHLPAPAVQVSSGLIESFGWQEVLMVLFFAVPVFGTVLGAIFGRKLGTLITGASAGGLAWVATTSLVFSGAVGMVAMLITAITGLGDGGGNSARGGRGGRGGRSNTPVIWGGGGSSDGGFSSGGDFSSGGGGDFGGGGASGSW